MIACATCVDGEHVIGSRGGLGGISGGQIEYLCSGQHGSVSGILHARLVRKRMTTVKRKTRYCKKRKQADDHNRNNYSTLPGQSSALVRYSNSRISTQFGTTFQPKSRFQRLLALPSDVYCNRRCYAAGLRNILPMPL